MAIDVREEVDVSAEMAATASATGADDLLLRVARWVIMKVWLGCALSAWYAVGHRFGWPELVLTIAAVLGAILLALASLGLPRWTVEHNEFGVGIAFVDIGVRVLVWLGLTACVVALLVSAPAVGSAGGALWLTTVIRTFGPWARAWSYRRHRTV